MLAEKQIGLTESSYSLWPYSSCDHRRQGLSAITTFCSDQNYEIFLISGERDGDLAREFHSELGDTYTDRITTIDEFCAHEFGFTPDGALRALRRYLSKAQSEGRDGLVVVIDYVWILSDGSGIRNLNDFSTRLIKACENEPIHVVAACDRRPLSSTKLLNIMPLFPSLLLGESLFQNRYYESPKRRASEGDRHARVLDDVLTQVEDRAYADQRYARLIESTNVLGTLEGIFDSMGDGLLVTDESGKMLVMNKTAESILGYGFSELPAKERAKLFGNHLPDKVTPYPVDDLPTFKALRGESSDEVEIFIRNQYRPEGCWTSTTARPLRNKAGDLNGAVLIFRDITQAKATEEQNERLSVRIGQAQKLESLGLLAGGIAHDFNNLLMGVLGNASLALLGLDGNSDVQKRVLQIQTAAQRLAALTRQLLAYSGQGSFERESIDISFLASEMNDLLETVVSKKATVTADYADNLPPIHADPTQVRQILMNLLTNASDALDGEAGSIRAETGVMNADRSFLDCCIIGSGIEPGEYVFVEVEDSGCGMDAVTMNRIFDPFFTTKTSGRGLGLASVLGLVRRHEGALFVDSQVGRGTRFRVLFPADWEYEARRDDRGEVSVVEGREGANRVILVIDDEESVRELAQEMLEHYGFEVLAAANGHDGIELYRKHADSISAVLLDLTMPDIGGDEVFSEIKKLRPNAKIIISSGYSETADLGLLYDNGLAGYLQKPYVPQALYEKINQAIA